MRVDGEVFKSARKKIRAASPGRGEFGKPAKGTQEWLADGAKLSLRAVQYLERGEASFKTIQAASDFLGVPHWEEHICDYGVEFVTCSAKRLVDFRPEMYPPGASEQYTESCLVMSIDPLSILVEEGKFRGIQLKEISATLSGLDTKIEFTWLAEVLLTPAGNGWLGWVQEVEEMYLPANNLTVNIPIMFKQTNVPQINWGDFVDMIDNSDENQIHIDMNFIFSRFEKNIRIFLSIELLQRLFEEGRLKYKSIQPYRAQIKAVT